MGEHFEERRSAVRPPGEQLNSWKEIAVYFNRDVTTVQRWEKREEMPIHRHLHDKIGSVYAFRGELDAWAWKRNLKASQENATSAVEPELTILTSPDPVLASSDPVLAPEEATPPQLKRRTFLPAWIFLLATVGLAVAAVTVLLLRKADYFWRNPIEDARFQTITDFDGVARDAALSRDGHFVAFLSDHEGQMDVWITQVGSGEFHNLTHGLTHGSTHGGAPELINPSVRTLGFSADSSLVTFWVRKRGEGKSGGISIWAVPTLGGQPRPYLEGAAELDWSQDGSRIAYHTPGPGDPMFVSYGLKRSTAAPLFTAPAGLHSHFPVWSPDAAFLYFVQGSLPDKLDIWRIAANGGARERITSHSGYVSHPVLLDRHTLIYLASDADGSGPWPYGMDLSDVALAKHVPHRLTSGPEHYTSLAADAGGQRIAATLATPKRTLWRMQISDRPENASVPSVVTLETSAGFSPRFGPNYLLYVSTTGGSDSIRKLSGGIGTELWSAPGSRVLGAPVVSADGRFIAFSVRQNGQSRLYVTQADGTNTHVVADSLDLQGDPAWARDGRSITLAVNNRGVPHLFRLPIDGGAPASFVKEYSIDPVWVPDGRWVLYSGADVGTNFSIKAVKADGLAQQMPALTMTRGARHVVFRPDGRSLILLRGEIQHKDFFSVDLETGKERQLTRLPADFDIRDFDLSPDGREVVMERVQERSDIVLLELPRR